MTKTYRNNGEFIYMSNIIALGLSAEMFMALVDCSWKEEEERTSVCCH